MTSKSMVDDFLAQPTLAVVGVSLILKAFANGAYKELKEKGYRVLPVNPHMETFDGAPCYPSLKALPEPPGGAVDPGSPAQAEGVVQDAGRGRRQAGLDAAGGRIGRGPSSSARRTASVRCTASAS